MIFQGGGGSGPPVPPSGSALDNALKQMGLGTKTNCADTFTEEEVVILFYTVEPV